MRIIMVSGALLVLPFMASAADLASTTYVDQAIQYVDGKLTTVAGRVTDIETSISDTIIDVIGEDVAGQGPIFDAINEAAGGALDTKQNMVGDGTVDTSPTVGSTRIVTSGGVATALAGKADLVTGDVQTLQQVGNAGVFAIVDAAGQPQRGFTVGTLAAHVQAQVDGNIPQAVLDAMGDELDGKQDIVGDGLIDTAPTAGSNRIVTSGGVFTAIDTVTSAVNDLGALADLDIAARADLAADVTTSLDLADTAIQPPTGCVGSDCALVRLANGNFQWFNIVTTWTGS